MLRKPKHQYGACKTRHGQNSLLFEIDRQEVGINTLLLALVISFGNVVQISTITTGTQSLHTTPTTSSTGRYVRTKTMILFIVCSVFFSPSEAIIGAGIVASSMIVHIIIIITDRRQKSATSFL